MDEPSLVKNPSELRRVYFQRRLTIFGAVIAVIVILTLMVILTAQPIPVDAATSGQDLPDAKPSPIYEREPPAVPANVVNTTNETDNCTLEAPIRSLGCLEPNDGPNIFGAYGLNFDDKSVKQLIKKVEAECNITDSEGPVNRDCIVRTAVTQSENSWVCKWDCLEDISSCETYKMHLAVAILRKYVPPTDVFVARTANFDFFMIYKDDQGEWMQPQFIFLKNPVAEAIYNDVYHAGPITQVVYPDIQEVEPGDSFCFDVNAPRSCVCTVEVTSFTVGDCPQVPADLRGICDTPVSEVYLQSGSNQICFTVSEDADEEFYTYNFELTSGEEFVPAGNAFIKEKKWDCCVNESFKGFLSID